MLPWETTLARQLEEIHVIRCSLLPGEYFAFVLPPEDLAVWITLLDLFTNVGGFSNDDDAGAFASLTSPPCQARFEMRLSHSRIWFEVELPSCTDPPLGQAAANIAATSISVKGEHLSRDAHEGWHAEIRARTAEIDDACVFPVYELLTLLTVALHDSDTSNPDSTSITLAPASTSAPIIASSQQNYHALFTSHHLVSPTKRRSMRQWSSQLGVAGFAKVGYPGVIYAEGPQDAVETFVRNVKGMQWLALRVRFVEPVPDPAPGGIRDQSVPRGERWVEVSKIGEVLEQMRMRGKETLATDLGIGAPSKEAKR